MMERWVSHTAPTLTVLVQTYMPCQGTKKTHWLGVFFLPVQFCKAVDFALAVLHTNVKWQYLMNYSLGFNSFADSDF